MLYRAARKGNVPAIKRLDEFTRLSTCAECRLNQSHSEKRLKRNWMRDGGRGNVLG